MLYPLTPKAPGAAARRAMFVCEDLWALLNSPEGDDAWERRIASLRADLEYFVEGRAIDPKYVFRLSPAREAVWEIRSAREEPSIRVLGLFAEKDVFIATNVALREDLAGWETRAWRDAKLLARTKWGHLFHTYRPLGESDIHLLVSGALDGRYFRND
jgi:hypothetical protein